MWDYATGLPFQHLKDIPQPGSLDAEAVGSTAFTACYITADASNRGFSVLPSIRLEHGSSQEEQIKLSRYQPATAVTVRR